MATGDKLPSRAQDDAVNGLLAVCAFTAFRFTGDVPVRDQAAQQLLRIDNQGAFAGLVGGSPQPAEAPGVRSWAEAANLRDQRAVRQLVAGVTRWRRQLDFVIATVAGRSTDSLDAHVLVVLRLGAYELLHGGLAHHAISEHVQLARRLGRRHSAGLINGALRALAQRIESGTVPDALSSLSSSSSARDRARALAIALSHPTHMVTRWLQRWGQEDTLALLNHNNAPPTYSLRLNTLSGSTLQHLLQRLRELGVDAQPSALLPAHFVRVQQGMQAVLRGGLVASGVVSVQCESAGLVVAALDPQPGERLLDCCAAPGGKTMYAAQRMGGRGSILAVDVSASRLSALEAAAEQAGLAGMMAFRSGDLADVVAQLQHEAADAAAWQFDRVLLDAPCSGSGVLSKRADMRWRTKDMGQLVELQARLLDAAAAAVKPEGGILVYSTCSMEDEENGAQVAAFLARHPEFELLSVAADLPPAVVTPQGHMATLPFRHGVDGAFAAKMRRK